jgi:hypothetical protein
MKKIILLLVVCSVLVSSVVYADTSSSTIDYSNQNASYTSAYADRYGQILQRDYGDLYPSAGSSYSSRTQCICEVRRILAERHREQKRIFHEQVQEGKQVLHEELQNIDHFYENQDNELDNYVTYRSERRLARSQAQSDYKRFYKEASRLLKVAWNDATAEARDGFRMCDIDINY